MRNDLNKTTIEPFFEFTGSELLYLNKGLNYILHDFAKRTVTVLVSGKFLKEKKVLPVGLSADRRQVLVLSEIKRHFRYSRTGIYHTICLDNKTQELVELRGTKG